MCDNICINHPTHIFGNNVDQMKQEWQQEEMEPDYGCVCNDLMILEWIDLFDPVKTFKSQGLYELLKSLIQSETVSGVLYRGSDFDDHYQLQVGDIINYSDRLTSWSDHIDIAAKFTWPDHPLILKLVCNQVKGLKLKNRDELESILDECNLIIVATHKYNNGRLFEVVIN